MKLLVTGGAGYIGSVVAALLGAQGHDVVVLDDLSTGHRDAVPPSTRFVHGTVREDAATVLASGFDAVLHFAAKSLVGESMANPSLYWGHNLGGTLALLEAMRITKTPKIIFSSTAATYGEPESVPITESAPTRPTSPYGASKLAGEGLVSAYCTGYGFSGWVFRFVSILGERYTHGHVFDFVRQLRADPANLRILGDGKQRKSYLYVQDCVDAMMLALEERPHGYQVLNLGTDEYVSVEESVSLITRVMGVKPRLSYTGGARGWVGDSPFIFLDCAKIRALGWMPRLRIAGAIERTTKYLLDNPSLLDRRS